MPTPRIPDRHLPAPPVRELPAPISLRRMIGPSIILAGLAVGSGEFVMWPQLTVTHGFALFWACWIGVTVQFFINMEIERWTLATGESAVTGFFRMHRVFGPVFLFCATLPWIWPGWATGAAELLVAETGGEKPAIVPVAIGGLVLAGIALSLGPVVYRTVEMLSMILVASIFAIVVVIAWQVVEMAHVREMFAGAVQFGNIPDGVHMPTLFGAVAFAGAGGALNLAQSSYIRDKGYGMGRWVGRITSPLTGKPEDGGLVGAVFEGSESELVRWRTWWRRTNLEHFFSFFLLCLVSLCLFSLVARALLGTGADIGEGFSFIHEQGRVLEERFGAWARHAFLWGGVLVLFSTEFALLDAVSRVAADAAKATWSRGLEAVPLSRIYFVTLWTLIGFGIVVLLLGFDKPLALLVMAATLNGFVMCLYSALLLVMNLRAFRGELRPHPVRLVVLGGACAFFGWFCVLTLIDKLGG
ncbi:MAG: hypothetical protein CMJ83_03995 [Planctomycetes bacterium]|nr:hypothetical protein [Planctomycetota bacterium]